MQKGKWHRDSKGKLVRRRGPYKTTRRKVVHNAEVVHPPIGEIEDTPSWTDDLDKDRLEVILDALWKILSPAQKVLVLSSQYFDPSNPSGE